MGNPNNSNYSQRGSENIIILFFALYRTPRVHQNVVILFSSFQTAVILVYAFILGKDFHLRRKLKTQEDEDKTLRQNQLKAFVLWAWKVDKYALLLTSSIFTLIIAIFITSVSV